jgi:hypothetical protein
MQLQTREPHRREGVERERDGAWGGDAPRVAFDFGGKLSTGMPPEVPGSSLYIGGVEDEINPLPKPGEGQPAATWAKTLTLAALPLSPMRMGLRAHQGATPYGLSSGRAKLGGLSTLID